MTFLKAILIALPALLLFSQNATSGTYSTDQFVFHIIKTADWAKASKAKTYAPDSIKKEGFIHASKSSQLLHVANKYFKGKSGLSLLVIDTKKVKPTIDYSYKGYPHIQGALNRNAVVDTVAFAPNADGSFALPAALK